MKQFPRKSFPSSERWSGTSGDWPMPTWGRRKYNLLLGKASKKKHNKLGFLAEVRVGWVRGGSRGPTCHMVIF